MTISKEFKIELKGAEANNLVFKPAFKSDDIKNHFYVLPNLTVGTHDIMYAQYSTDILRSYAGCGFNPSGIDDFTNKTISVDKMSADKEYCWTAFQNILIQSLFEHDKDWADLTDTVLAEVIKEIYQFAISEHTIKLAYFGQKSSSDPSFSVTDGVFTKYYPDAVAAGLTPYLNITNTALTPGSGIDILREVHKNQKNTLYGIAKSAKVFNVSRSVAEQYQSDLENLGAGDFGAKILVGGVEKLAYRGIEVVEHSNWDAYAAQAGLSERNFVELTTRFNKVMGTNVMSADNSFKMWYNEEDEMVRLKSRPIFGFQLMHEELSSVAW